MRKTQAGVRTVALISISLADACVPLAGLGARESMGANTQAALKEGLAVLDVKYRPNGGQFDFVWLSTRTPHGAYVW